MRNPFRREPDVQITITANGGKTASEVMFQLGIFTRLVMKHDLDLVKSSPGGEMTLSGQPKRIAAFEREFGLLQAAGVL